MPSRFKQRIIEHLAHDTYRPAEAGAIARDMRIDPGDRAEFEQTVEQLVEEGRLSVGGDLRLRLPSLSDADEMEVIGSFRLHPRGFGFIIPETKFREGDIFVPQGSTGGAMSRDRVRAKIVKGRRGGGKGATDRKRGGGGGSPSDRSEYIARIVEVIERGHEHFTGTLIRRGNQWLVEPDGRVLHEPLVIRDPHAKTPGKAKEGDKVVFEITQYPDDRFTGEGVITKVLGEAGRPDVETQAVIASHNLRVEFDESVLQEAREASRMFEGEQAGPWEDREDLTGDEWGFTFTIDPPDAKDFDDAISIAHNKDADEWTLGVHIADVSHFVRSGGAMDEEAKARGNSVYLPRLVIPMLPEVLSNGVCSLQEGVNRFTKSVFITFDGKGKVLRQRVANTVIRSRKRLTYLEAQALIDGNESEARKHARTEANYTDELLHALRLSDRLAKILEQRRQRDGMIVLNLPEVELVFDEEGHVVDAVPEDNAYTHKLIEMFMVEANEALARLFEDLNVPILRRIHPEPSFGDMQELRLFAMAADVRVPDEPTRKDLQVILDATRHTPAARAIHFAVLRTLTKAEYSPALIGHFALASEHYAHYTSPIRRYPDLTLHRAMDAYLDLTDNGKNPPGGKKRNAMARRLLEDPRVPDEGELINLGRHTSSTEVEAEQAERELREFLVLQFLHEKHLGDEFTGVITGMIGSAVFISLDRFLIEGRIAVRDLPSSEGKPDRWIVEETVGRARAQRSGAVLAVGDIVTVQVVAIDLAARKLDLAITKIPERTGHGKAGEGQAAPRPKGARFAHQADASGTRRGKALNQQRRGKKHRSGFKQGRRGRKS
jgi:ribonuclease R